MISKIEEINHQKEEITNLVIEIMIGIIIKIIQEMDIDQTIEIMMVKMVSKKEIIIDIKIIMVRKIGKEIITEIMAKIISETIIKRVEMVIIMVETDLETIIDVH